jgi:K+-transporting ATPase KdpF subunit
VIGCEAAMILDYALAAVVTLGVLAYLVFALIRPERF